jgi:hypothetical protein
MCPFATLWCRDGVASRGQALALRTLVVWSFIYTPPQKCVHIICGLYRGLYSSNVLGCGFHFPFS